MRFVVYQLLTPPPRPAVPPRWLAVVARSPRHAITLFARMGAVPSLSTPLIPGRAFDAPSLAAAVDWLLSHPDHGETMKQIAVKHDARPVSEENRDGTAS